MKNLTLIIALSLGLFVLGTFANSGTIKAMFKKRGQGRDLPLFFKVRFLKTHFEPANGFEREINLIMSTCSFHHVQFDWHKLKDAMDI